MNDRNDALLFKAAHDALGALVALVPEAQQQDASVHYDVLQQALAAFGNSFDTLRQIAGKLYHNTNEVDRRLGQIGEIKKVE